MQDFRQLQVWQKAHQLVLGVYDVTRTFPSDERYGLTSQIRRASVSIGANIAEGCGRGGGADFARFLQIALGSAAEVEYLMIVARDLQMLDNEHYRELNSAVVEIKRMLTSLSNRVRAGSTHRSQKTSIEGGKLKTEN